MKNEHSLNFFWSNTPPHFYLFEMSLCLFRVNQDECYTEVFLQAHIRCGVSSACQFNGRAGSSHSFSTPLPPYPTPLSYTGFQPRSYSLQSQLLCNTTAATMGCWKSVNFVCIMVQKKSQVPRHTAAKQKSCIIHVNCTGVRKRFPRKGFLFFYKKNNLNHNQMFHNKVRIE